MAGSAADTPEASTGPQFARVSDADRDQAIDELRREFADGRLSHDTFMVRMQGALDARRQADLDGLFTDLPRRPGRMARLGEVLRRWRQSAGNFVDDMTRYPRRDNPAQHGYPSQHGYPGQASLPVPMPSAPPLVETPPRSLAFPPLGTEASFTIGRDQRCDLFISDLSVSRLHARLTRDGTGWVLTDLGSTNGTRINGWRVREPVPLRAGDIVRFGSANFVMQEKGEHPDGGAPSG
jgi:hypothetical protein